MDSRRSTLNAIAKRLSVLVGGALVASTGYASATPANIPIVPRIQTADAAGTNQLPSKLILKQKVSGFRLIAQHDSHSSHASHASHASHSSHSSRAI